ncbi:MAG: DUF983 domain-containing protein [Rhodomicrobium sp.]|nr:DUF983 domain-containing protein [Rhodomicrobium sp.]
MYEIHSRHPADIRSEPAQPKRQLFTAMWRGLRGRCPSCGEGRLFARYLKVADHCPACGEALYHHRADDAPPYFTILIAGHLIVPLLLAFEVALKPPLWLHAALWMPVTVGFCLALLPMVKGAIVGLQWALYMHGFDPNAEDEAALAEGESLG